jgi:hypothetical protein
MEKINLDFTKIKHFPHNGKIVRPLIVEVNRFPLEEYEGIYAGQMRIENTTAQVGNLCVLANYDVWMSPVTKDGKLHCPIQKEDILYVVRQDEKIKAKIVNVYPSQLGIRLYASREIWGETDDINFEDLV